MSNNVNEVETKNSEDIASRRRPVCERAYLGCQSDTVSPEQSNKIVPPIENEKIGKGLKRRICS